MQQSTEKKQIPLHLKTSVHQFSVLQNPEKSNEQNIEKVREILFGSQMKRQEQQISAVEFKNQENLKELRQILLSRLEDFEVLFKSEIKNLNQRINKEHEARLLFEEKNQTDIIDLKSFVLKRSQHLSEEISASKMKSAQDFKNELDVLDQQKVDRSQLSNFLTDWVLRFENRTEANSGNPK